MTTHANKSNNGAEQLAKFCHAPASSIRLKLGPASLALCFEDCEGLMALAGFPHLCTCNVCHWWFSPKDGVVQMGSQAPKCPLCAKMAWLSSILGNSSIHTERRHILTFVFGSFGDRYFENKDDLANLVLCGGKKTEFIPCIEAVLLGVPHTPVITAREGDGVDWETLAFFALSTHKLIARDHLGDACASLHALVGEFPAITSGLVIGDSKKPLAKKRFSGKCSDGRLYNCIETITYLELACHWKFHKAFMYWKDCMVV